MRGKLLIRNVDTLIHPHFGLLLVRSHLRKTGQFSAWSTQRAGAGPPHAARDGLSGVTSDGETFAFISGPVGVVGGVPVTRAMIPWAMPEAST